MTPNERLRLAVSLAHCVPASELRLHTVTDEVVVVSAHPSADIDTCAMRRFVCAAARPGHPDHSRRVRSVEFRGSLGDVGGGVFRVVSVGEEQRWISSLLEPQRISMLLADLELGGLADQAVHACLKPDSELGVTLIVITADDDHVGLLDELATRAAAAIYVEEMRCQMTHDLPAADGPTHSVTNNTRRSS